MHTKITAFILTLCLTATATAQEVSELYLRIDPPLVMDSGDLTRVVSISSVKGDTLWVYAAPEAVARLDLAGVHYTLLPSPNETFQARMAESFDELREWDVYPTYSQYLEMMYRFGENYPSICRVENIGTSVDGRELLFVKISDNVSDEEDEPEFMYSSTMHGNEIVGYVLMLRLIDHLLTNYGVDPRITNLVNSIEIWINPLANPDGTYNGGDNTVAGAVRMNANGVDLNRNFPDFMDGPHPDGNVWQPENIAMMNFIADHSFTLSSNLHSGSEVVNYPWDTTPVLTADDDWWQQVSHAYADTVQSYSPGSYFNGFNDGITNGYQWYEVNGGRQDYLNYYHHCREMTLELSDEQMLPAEELPAHWDYNRAAFLNYIEASLYGIRGVVTGSTGEPLAASITIPGHDFDNSNVLTDPDVGDYHRFLAPGVYDVRIDAFGYAPQTFENITVVSNQTVVQNAVLTPLPEIMVSGFVTETGTDEPLTDALVELPGMPYAPVYSGPDGEFEIPGVFEGDYVFHVFAEGYAALLDTFSVMAGMEPLQFELSPSDIISFEDGGLPANWATSGSMPWSITDDTASDGLYSARSGDINDNEISVLSVTVEAASADQVSFFCRVASEDDVNDNWDYLKFEIDGTELDRWDGQVGWHEEVYPVTAGLHTFTWTYRKDGSVSHFEDAGWIDAISLPTPPNSGDLLIGDINADDAVDILDIVMLVNFILNIEIPTADEFAAGDADQNGLLNVLDLITIVNLILDT
ncbi:MAG: hypothetical protein GXO91_02665 [FCB group bacterium]|nr:hypothetical protein [FCB group bacterium]